MIVYKIMNDRGLFSEGGEDPQFGKKGKTWTNIGHLKNHLRLARPYRNCELVTIVRTEVVTELTDIGQFMVHMDNVKRSK